MTWWSLLGISPTDDESVIKKAYAQKLKIFHPEEDPEGYQKLREAYDRAIKYAKAQRKKQMDVPAGLDILIPEPVLESDDREREQEADREPLLDERIPPPPKVHLQDTIINPAPSMAMQINDFMGQFQALYQHFFSRIDSEKWTLLLSSDVLWQVGYKQQLNDRVMQFLQTHHHFPKDVWQLLESNFRWREEKEYLLRRFPEQLITYIFKQLDQLWELRYSHFKAYEGVDYDRFVDYREQALDALIANDLELAGRCMTEAHAIYPDDPDLLRMQCEYYLRIGDAERALIACNHAIRVSPDELDGYYYRAQIQYSAEHYHDAIGDCEHILSRKPESLHALWLQARCYMMLGEMEHAKTRYIQVLNQNPYDFEATTGLAQVNAQLAESLMAKSEKPDKRVLAPLFKELGKPAWIGATVMFLHILLRRTWIYGLLLVIGLLFLNGTLSKDSAPYPEPLAPKAISTTQSAVEVQTQEDLRRSGQQKQNIIVGLTMVKCPDMYSDYIRDESSGTTKAIYPGFNEVGGISPDYGYVCLGYLDDKTVIFTGNIHHWSAALYKPPLYKLKGRATKIASPDLLKAVESRISNDPRFDSYLDNLNVDTYIEARDENELVLTNIPPPLPEEWRAPKALYVYAGLICCILALLIREIRRTYRAVQF
ncbi:hypothetical protein GCM10008018_58690 [Paenibacillus marchantiophytorum]|uniref:J domain-containing protein n=1 Tax=Paenibacillus marchantiophytorum TaxID=1619310 RepID=A0ABQ1FBB4_9BACL|nr:J domain-containing protein [Paenibacillus marchantiophytorum]GGA05001.1 hypothetical protein GCM10008018_58690 [Paenibacillus marchantiophytorum]